MITTNTAKGKMKVKQTKKIIIINTAKPSSTAGEMVRGGDTHSRSE